VSRHGGCEGVKVGLPGLVDLSNPVPLLIQSLDKDPED